jgi:conjugal transfer pilin signal peptidase TrbI
VDLARRRFAIKAFAGVLLAIGVTQVATDVFGSRWTIFLDKQKESIVCLPWMGYLTDRKANGSAINRGDLVSVSARGIPHPKFKDGAVMGKIVAGLPGDIIDVRNEAVWINGVYWGEIDLLAKLKKEKGAFDRHEIVPPGHYFVMGSGSRSYDSRYWGFVEDNQIIGRSVALF